MKKAVFCVCCILVLSLGGCSRQQSDWEKTRAANTAEAFEQFMRKYPNGEFAKQAEARLKELYEERDWQKARDTDTQEAYQGYLKEYPEGKWAVEARNRVEDFTLAQAPSNGSPNAEGAADAGGTGARSAATAPAPSSAPAEKPALSAAPRPQAPKSQETKSGAYGVQLGAFKSSADAAHRRWEHLQKDHPQLLAGLSPTVSPKQSDAGTVYRLQITKLTSERARSICKTLNAKSQGCVLLRPPKG